MTGAASVNGAWDGAPADVPASLIAGARRAAGVLAGANLVYVLWMILNAPQGLSGLGYAVSLAILVLAGVLMGFLAAHPRARIRPMTFARVGRTAAWVQTACLALLVGFAWQARHSEVGLSAATWFYVRVGMLVLTLATVVAFSAIAQPRPTFGLLHQTAHKSIALAILLVLARVGLAIWGRPIEVTPSLLPWAIGLISLAGLAATGMAYVAREPEQAGEARGLLWTVAIMIVPLLAAVTFF
jgi:hypothetical protein